MRQKKTICALVFLLGVFLAGSSVVQADDVTDWNQHMLRAGQWAA